MPYTDTPDPVIATLTDIGRTNFARVITGEISFKLKGFAVGRGGYLDPNPVHITPITTSSTTLIDHFFPTAGGIKSFELLEFPTPKTIVANCRLASSEAVAGLGELGIWSEIIYSSVSPVEVGTEYLMAVAHFPLVTKTTRQAIVYRAIIQF